MSVCKGSGGRRDYSIVMSNFLTHLVTWYCVTNDVGDSVGDVLDFRT